MAPETMAVRVIGTSSGGSSSPSFTSAYVSDFMPVHHDRDYAKQQGSPNLFMNILTSNGYCVRFLTDWAGPDAVLKKVAIRLGAPNYPDDTMLMTGRVKAKRDDGLVEVEIKGENSLGDHVTGTVSLVLPS